MLDDKVQKDVEIKVSILELIKKTAKPLLYRLDTLLRDHYTETYTQTDNQLTYLIEYTSAARILIQSLEKYIDISLVSGEDIVSVSFEDFTIITHTSKVVEQGYRVTIGKVPLWIH